MNRDSLLKRTTKPRPVEVGGEVVANVRKLSAAEVQYMRTHYKGDEAKALEGCRYIVATCTVDDAGNPIFKPEDINGDLKGMDHELVDAITKAALNFSGIATEPKNG
jgi:stage V sporulation protein SpoVS